ncbi:hypothetical protein [Mycobacterium sp. NAZ190054]|uniref:hypothetical protein n=1 Tax=Mycobacterium sp. NAZ190054 TaxID=1747766 RepID=UPI0012E3B2FF|nr:hypothetical protein [Mycobacterium sp. NAZ190054]
MTITMPPRVDALLHWRSHHPRHVCTDWDVHGHPHHLAFIENALLAREMDRL